MPKRIARCLRSALSIIVVYVVLAPVQSASASADDRQTALICENAALVVSQESNVPLDVLRAISLTETGRKGAAGFLPWPWTVNMEGAGRWFDDRNAARDFVNRHFNRGARSFDVGCFQINYRWHGQAFASIDEMFEPLANARYAAKFLGELYEEFGDWTLAAGAFHSRTPRYARKYKARFTRIRAGLEDLNDAVIPEPAVLAISDPPALPPTQTAARVNRYPLLQVGRSGTTASLVPLHDAISPRFLDIGRTVSVLGSR